MRKRPGLSKFLLAGLALIFFLNLLAFPAGDKLQLDQAYGSIPLYFTANIGQAHSDVLFYTKTPGFTLWLTKKAFVFDRINTSRREVCQMNILKATRDLIIQPFDIAPHKVHLIKGSNPKKWKRDIPTSQGVTYLNIYPNVDLKVYGAGYRIEYDWIIKTGGTPDSIQFQFAGVKKTYVNEKGNLAVQTSFGQTIHQKPGAFQVINGRRVRIEAEFKKTGNNTYGYQTGSYDTKYNLVIDPLVLVYSTYLGGDAEDSGESIAVDNQGNAYITGYTMSNNFPTTPGVYDKNTNGDWDVFVTKINPDGSELVYSTFIGGSAEDRGCGIDVDSSGSAYVAGKTLSTNFPTSPGAFSSNNSGEEDAFLLKLNPSGSKLTYSTYIGGQRPDYATGVAVNKNGQAFITGSTHSGNFPDTPGAHERQYSGRYDAFVTKFNASGTGLVYSTYVGGNELDWAYDIAVDGAGSAYITGYTDPYILNLFGANKAYAAKLNPSGSKLVYYKQLNGSDDDQGIGIAVDNNGSAVVTGWTESNDFPVTQSAFDKNYNGGIDGFVARLNPSGSLAYSTYIGGNKDDSGTAAQLTSSGSVFITGYTKSPDFPTTKDAFQKKRKGGNDVFLLTLDPGGNTLQYSTYMGGGGDDRGFDIILDDLDAVYMTGRTASANFPSSGSAFDDSLGGSKDAYAVKFSAKTPFTVTITNLQKGEKVCGDVDIKATAQADEGIKKVDFYINNSLIGSDFKSPYVFTWESLDYKKRSYIVKAVAADLSDKAIEDKVKVFLRNEKLTLLIEPTQSGNQVTNKIELAVKTFNCRDKAKRYKVLRKKGAGSFKSIKKIPASELQDGLYAFTDSFSTGGKTYSYKVVAIAAGGNIIGKYVSKTLQAER